MLFWRANTAEVVEGEESKVDVSYPALTSIYNNMKMANSLKFQR